MMLFTPRQLEMLKAAAGPHGVVIHTQYDAAVMERLFVRELVLRSCNGTAKWHATGAGRAALEDLKK